MDNNNDKNSEAVGQGDLIETPRDLIARNEFNLEKWSGFIFPHARTKDLDKRRSVEYEVDTPDGTEMRSLSITPLAGEKAYTNRTYTTLLALIIWWHQHPTSDGNFKVHLSDLARIKGIATKGKNLSNIYEDLDRLDGTRMDWDSSFLDEYGTPQSFNKIHIITGLSGKSHEKNRANRYITGTFTPPFLRNLIAGKTNPKNLTSILKIRSEIGQVLFRYIDTKIYKKAHFEKRSKSLFTALGLDSADIYKKMSRRKTTLERVVKAIDKSTLTTGNLLRIKIEATTDNKDVKIVCNSIASELIPAPRSKVKPAHTDKAQIVMLAQDIRDAVQAKDSEPWISWTERLAKYYPDNVIYRVLGEYKEIDRHSETEIDDRGKFFTSHFHRTVHNMGMEWIGKDCKKSCKLRPENNPQKQLF